MPTHITECKEQLAFAAGNAADFRSRKAEEYPDDERNPHSSPPLCKLPASLEALPLDHPGIVNVCQVLNSIFDVPNDDLWDRGQRLQELDNEMFGRYGFDCPESGDAGDFLVSYLEALKGLARDALESESG